MNFLTFNVQRLLGVPFEDMGKHFKGGGGKQVTNSSSTSTPHQQGQYDKLLKGADSWLNSGGYDKNYGGSADFDPVADMSQEQLDALAGMSGTGAGLSDIYNGLGMDSLRDSLGQYDPTKTGINDALGAMYEQSQWNYDTSVAPQIRQGATEAGQFGSSRHGIAEGLSRDRLNQTQANTASQMVSQDQQNWNNQRANTLNNLSAISKGLNSGNTMQYDAEAIKQGQAQQEILGQLQKWAYENNVDVNDLSAYKALISGDMGGVNVTNSVTKGGGGGSSPWGAIGTIGGAIAGSFVGMPQVGAAIGGGIGSRIG